MKRTIDNGKDFMRCRGCRYYDTSRFPECGGKLAICANKHSGLYKVGYKSLASKDCFAPKEVPNE